MVRTTESRTISRALGILTAGIGLLASSAFTAEPQTGGYVDSGRVPTSQVPSTDNSLPQPRIAPSAGSAAQSATATLPVFPATPPTASRTTTLPIDLPYALRLANTANPTIAVTVERVRQANAGLQAAKAAFLPDLWIGGNPDNFTFLPTFYHHGGNIQNAAGSVFSVNKNNLALPLGTSLNWKTADVFYGPRIARSVIAAERARSQTITNNIQLDVALTYLDLLRAYGALAVNAEMQSKATQMLDYAEQGEKSGLGKTTADANRARTEVELLKREQRELEGTAAEAAARLAQLLLLEPSVDLVPAEARIVPIALVDTDRSFDELIATGLMNRPELAENRALITAALDRWHRDRSRPLYPTISLVYYGAEFGGSSDLTNTSPFHNWGGRDDFFAQAAWELKGAGFGDLAKARASRAQYNEANLHFVEMTAQVSAEVTAATKLVLARERGIRNAEIAVKQAEEMWTRLLKASFGLATGARRYDPLEPLIAEQQLRQARLLYLDEVIGFNRYQFRLFWAMGQPPLCALPAANPKPVQTPVIPQQSSK